MFETIGNIIKEYYKWILEGIGYTMLVALIGTIVGLGIGILIGVFRTIPTPRNKFLKVLKKIADVILSAYVVVFRCTPMLVQAMVIFLGFALLTNGQTLDVTF
ncbi:MAG: amino acid ABC transporter permease, partial [Clostridia bacterium]|nr:amino acid ABC transporter permease [Clostridia bacterium]